MSILKDWFKYTKPEKKQMKVTFNEIKFDSPADPTYQYFLRPCQRGPEWVTLDSSDDASDWCLDVPIEVLKAMVANLPNLNKPVKVEVPF